MAAVAGTGVLGGLAAVWNRSHGQQLADRSEPWLELLDAEDLPLVERAARKGVLYGAATNHRALQGDPAFAARFLQECGVLVPEYELKWSKLRPDPETYHFGPADWLVEYAVAHGLEFRGHTLVWHSALPAWFHEVVTKDNAERILVEHIRTVVKRYAGAVHSWDVVNEAVLPGDSIPGGLRRSPWLDLLGREYIEIAFWTAAEADPNARLVYNEFELDYATRAEEAKRRAVLELLERLVSSGVPIHALGMQAHLRANRYRFDPEVLQAFLRDVANLGLEIYITEMDVRDHRLPTSIRERDAGVARTYWEYLSAVLEVPQVKAVLTWGLSDRYTWLRGNGHAVRSDGTPVRPLPLDDQLERKEAWGAIARAFDTADPR